MSWDSHSDVVGHVRAVAAALGLCMKIGKSSISTSGAQLHASMSSLLSSPLMQPKVESKHPSLECNLPLWHDFEIKHTPTQCAKRTTLWAGYVPCPSQNGRPQDSCLMRSMRMSHFFTQIISMCLARFRAIMWSWAVCQIRKWEQMLPQPLPLRWRPHSQLFALDC